MKCEICSYEIKTDQERCPHCGAAIKDEVIFVADDKKSKKELLMIKLAVMGGIILLSVISFLPLLLNK